MGRSKFPGKPSKHTHRKRINVLPPSGDMLNIEFGNPVTVKSVEENKQDDDVNDSDSESAPSENTPKVSLTRRLTRDIKTIRNKNATKRNLLSKMSSKRSNLSCKTLHNFSKTCRESTNLVGKFVLPTRSVHSSRVIKPNKRFISDMNEGVTLKRRMSVAKRQDEDKAKTMGSFISEQKCDIEKTAFTNGHKVVLRQARLKLPNHTGTQGPFSTKSNSFPPGTVTCGVCGAVRYYRFVKQARKFNIYSCESCRKFISKMIKRSSCGNKNAQSPLVCQKGQGMCHVSSVVRSQQRKLSKCAYKARCSACWLKMCLRTFHMPSSLKQGLTMMLPKDMQSIFNNSLTTLTWQSNVLLEQPKEGETIKKRSLRMKNPKPANPVTVQLPTSDINRQKIDLRGPRVKHVCRSASIVLGQPIATFTEGDKKCEQQEKNESPNCDKNSLDHGKGSTAQSETESTCSDKLSKVSGSSDLENSNRREKSYRNLTNLYSCSEGFQIKESN
ncbi:unnamed protein product [Acanthoscelides obtectus]|uniref:Nuclear receptor domain-containing protein n=1 Tax=Acanthoscelides obtectus TaxID=200917 RepID=A0A9P0JRF9_ACAOB|nr:unnamed protein product [Acanthoscelides obtectus]CAK1628976.1 Histone-lysine N-methyltransferase trithorax [Acanthoscelides obtectus]